MDFFEQYVSNTLAGSGNQGFFADDQGKETICRICYRVFSGGEYRYAFLFSNIIDSTYADGSHSHKNLVLDSWEIHAARVGITDVCDDLGMREPAAFFPLTFGGEARKTVHPGELFSSDRAVLSPKAGEYLCIEITFSGKRIPHHEESIIPAFVWGGAAWIPSKRHPYLGMIGCERSVKKRIAFLGDSITQGIGTPINSYAHWNSIVAERLGDAYAYWNLGLGYGRADDAASDGAWLFKAKQNDIVVVCYGVNDILRGFEEEKIKENLAAIVELLSAAGKKVILQTIPPFDYVGEKIAMWHRINAYIRQELRARVAFVFDTVPLLQKSEAEPHIARYGGHPNAEGCRLWGEALSMRLKEYLD